MGAPAESNKPLVVIVTGLSGAGRSVSIKSLEDLGFYCIDNLPVQMVESAVEFIQKNPEVRNYALGMDIRDKSFANAFSNLKSKLSQSLNVEVVFLTADEEVLSNRYAATRRKHPLLDTGGELVAAIRRERTLLQPVEAVADVSFDTSLWSPHYLARMIEDRYAKGNQAKRKLFVTVTSFGFKYGAPRLVDSLVDVRFISHNPHYVPDLKPRSGLEKPVQDYIFKDENATEFLGKLVDMFRFLMPLYYQEGKHYFRIAIGCTGGRHRSVAIAEKLAESLANRADSNILVSIAHRDLDNLN